MENAIILNIVLLSIIGAGVLLYLVWLGSSIFKMKAHIQNIDINSDERFEEIYKTNDSNVNEFHKALDKLDSRFDRRLNDLDNNINNNFEELSKGLQIK